MWRSQQVVILLLLVDWSILPLHLKEWSLDHFETRINMYMIKGYMRREKRFRTECFGVQEVRKFCEMNQYLKGQKTLFWSVPVPLIRGPVPLKLRGPPRQLRGPPLQNVGVSCPFVGKVFLVHFYHFWLNIWIHKYIMI